MTHHFRTMDQSTRSRYRLATSRDRCLKATGLPESAFSPFVKSEGDTLTVVQTVTLPGKIVGPVTVEPLSIEVDFEPLSYETAKAVIADAVFTPIEEKMEEAKDKKFCVQIEIDGIWSRSGAADQTSDRARDLEQDAKRVAMRNPGFKVRVVPSAGGRAVLRFRSKDGVLGSY